MIAKAYINVQGIDRFRLRSESYINCHKLTGALKYVFFWLGHNNMDALVRDLDIGRGFAGRFLPRWDKNCHAVGEFDFSIGMESFG